MRQNTVKDVVIVGAGGLGRELREWVDDINEMEPQYRLLGFIDDAPTKHGTFVQGVAVLGGLDWLAAHPDVGVIVAIGDPAAKRRVVERVGPRDYPVIVHPRAVVGKFVSLGAGTIVCPGAVLTTDITIGRFVAINFNLTVGHDADVGDFSLLAPGINISGFVRIGEGCNLGAGAVVLPSVSIGEWTIVGSGAVVTEEIAANSTAVGVPARVIKTRSQGWHLT